MSETPTNNGEQPDATVTRFDRIPSVSPITARLIQLLKTTEEIELTDEALAAVAGGPVYPRQRCYGYLASAIRYVRRAEGRVWQRLRGEGKIRLLDGNERITLCETRRRGQHRSAKASISILMTVDPGSLGHHRQSEYRVMLAMLGTMASISSTNARKRLMSESTVTQPLLADLLATLVKKDK